MNDDRRAWACRGLAGLLGFLSAAEEVFDAVVEVVVVIFFALEEDGEDFVGLLGFVVIFGEFEINGRASVAFIHKSEEFGDGGFGGIVFGALDFEKLVDEF